MRIDTRFQKNCAELYSEMEKKGYDLGFSIDWLGTGPQREKRIWEMVPCERGE